MTLKMNKEAEILDSPMRISLLSRSNKIQKTKKDLC